MCAIHFVIQHDKIMHSKVMLFTRFQVLDMVKFSWTNDLSIKGVP